MALAEHSAVCHPLLEWHWQDTHLFVIPCQNCIGRTLTYLIPVPEWHWWDTLLLYLTPHARMALAGHSPVCHPVPEWHWQDTQLFVILCQNGIETLTCLSSLARMALVGHPLVCHPVSEWHGRTLTYLTPVPE
jgi:hypothetical protein